jgi:hypothetical protein
MQKWLRLLAGTTKQRRKLGQITAASCFAGVYCGLTAVDHALLTVLNLDNAGPFSWIYGVSEDHFYLMITTPSHANNAGP